MEIRQLTGTTFYTNAGSGAFTAGPDVITTDAISIPEGDVKRITDSNGRILWVRPPEYREKDNGYTEESFSADGSLNLYPGYTFHSSAGRFTLTGTGTATAYSNMTQNEKYPFSVSADGSVLTYKVKTGQSPDYVYDAWTGSSTTGVLDPEDKSITSVYSDFALSSSGVSGAGTYYTSSTAGASAIGTVRYRINSTRSYRRYECVTHPFQQIPCWAWTEYTISANTQKSFSSAQTLNVWNLNYILYNTVQTPSYTIGTGTKEAEKM